MFPSVSKGRSYRSESSHLAARCQNSVHSRIMEKGIGAPSPPFSPIPPSCTPRESVMLSEREKADGWEGVTVEHGSALAAKLVSGGGAESVSRRGSTTVPMCLSQSLACSPCLISLTIV